MMLEQYMPTTKEPEERQTMIDALQRVMQQAEQLLPDEQAQLATQFQQVLDDLLADLEWERTLSSPRGLAILERLAEEAQEDIAAGDVEEGGFGG